MNWRERIEYTGFCMAAIAFLTLMVELAGWYRFGDVSEWVYEVLEHGSPYQFGAIAYLVIMLIFLSAKE